VETISRSSSAPKYLLARQAVAKDIKEGVYAPGTKIPSIQDLAGTLGIAPMTVRQAISGLVEEGILERRPGVGTFVRRRPGGKNIALVIFHKTRPLESGTTTSTIIEAFRREATARGRQVKAMLVMDPQPAPAQVFVELKAMDVGAVALIGFRREDRTLVAALCETFPSVLLLDTLPGVAAPTVTVDMPTVARVTVDYLVGRGRRMIGVWGLQADRGVDIHLSACVEAELRRHNRSVDKSLWQEGIGEPTPEATIKWTNEAVSSGRCPDGIIVTTRRLAVALHEALEERGKRLGVDVDIITLRRRPDAYTLRDPWPVIALNHVEAMRMGARLAAEQIEKVSEERGAPHLVAPCNLILPQEPKEAVSRESRPRASERR